MITVYYEDGSKAEYDNIDDAEEGILDTVFTIKDIVSDDGKNYYVSGQVEIVESN